ncbi:hypothetical protein N657DRAFT_689506 [Parathielavia appendiculata]|uniref:Uncharacterized protein n=1 Tax=Parathielavia appendiculata TaxID=2587402 RepID=A0AAN6Z5A7_9PEZI|nr:hypothetical protein N657DRAFT_689506 [Parathielavia appendiculata]
MPPRIRSSSHQPQQLLNYLESSPSFSLSPASALAPLHRPTPTTTATISPSPPPCSRRSFSATPAVQLTRMRRKFKDWCVNNALFREPSPDGSTNYVSRVISQSDWNKVSADMPFPNNPQFRSQPVLSEKAREMIWEAVMVKGMPLKAVSAQFHVDMRRVAAVVRMKEIEKKWERENKPMAYPYARAILGMLPRANFLQGEPPFEPINDIHVHSYTMQQLFVPTSESREFTRADAAKAFGDHILPPDDKMRIPELVAMERKIADGMEPRDAEREFIREARESEQAFAAKQQARLQAAEERRIRVDSGRGIEFRFEKINAEDVGPTGRSRRGVGWRYGVPFMDRKRGQVKIPTSVE